LLYLDFDDLWDNGDDLIFLGLKGELPYKILNSNYELIFFRLGENRA